jgi:hypothetical protein
VKWLKGRNDASKEVLAIVVNQRRYDTTGKRLRLFSAEELRAMSPEALERFKHETWLCLPDLIEPHAPLRFGPQRVELCCCDDCVSARSDWRKRTGRD